MLRTFVLPLLLLLPVAARALCTSDGVPQPAAVLERFLNADCLECWRDPATPAPGKDTLVLDWVLPGTLGENAPLSTVASPDALERLRTLKQSVPQRTAAVSSRRAGALVPVRAAQGQSFNDYVGTSIELAQPGAEPWQAWLLLVERLPAGTEGSPVPRNLVRNVFRPDWARPDTGGARKLAESRAMQIHEGASPERLRLVVLLQDGRGRMRAIAQTECP
ncbi:MAG TPA: hypothetical protein VF522_13370 [Ramlibacter sp.]|uniref:hypothetical protein n=1 Tax=Ramlibacter sp. TaxID=1917967 RepID=UPI002ED58A36